jgi:osmoprotectant transport system substrate-binding protein
LVAILLLVLAAAPLKASPATPQIVVTSKSFSESRLLGEMMAQMLEAHTHLKVIRRPGLGSTQICFAALQSKEIDIYPEYTGTAWAVLLKRKTAISDATRTYLEVARESQRRWDLEWLLPLGFNNTYAQAMQEGTARRLDITRISQLKGHLKNLRIGMHHEFLERMDGFRGLARTYSFKLPPGLRGMDHGLAYEGLAKEVVDLVDAYSTDRKLLRYKVHILEDDRTFFAVPLGICLTRHKKLTPAIQGMGLKDYEILLRIQLPLTTRTLMAGICTSTIISIGVATLAAFIGAGGLGDPIFTRLQLNDARIILSGALPAAGLAILTDFLLGRQENWLAPVGIESPPGS